MILRKPSWRELVMLRAIADYQFGWPAGDYLVPDNVVVAVSPSTRRIREIHGEEGLLAVLRAHDYMYSLSLHGAQRLLKGFKPPRLRAIVKTSSLDVILRRKSVYASDIVEVDEELRVGDEVVVVNEEDKLVGVGRLRLSPVEISCGCRGEAIRLRKVLRETGVATS